MRANRVAWVPEGSEMTRRPLNAMKVLPHLAGVIAGVVLGTAVSAQDRTALVIANTAYDGDAALNAIRRDTEKMSETLFGLGFTVERLENVNQAVMTAAISALNEVEGEVVIYFAGHGFAHEGASYLMPVGAGGTDPAALAGGSVDLDQLLGDNRILVLDTCHGAASQGIIGAGALDAGLAAAAQARENLLIMTAVQPGVACPPDQAEALTRVMLDQLTVPGLPAAQMLPPLPAPDITIAEDGTETETPVPGLWANSTLAEPFVFRRATSGARLTREDYQMLENVSPSARAQLLALWAEAGIAVDFAGEVGAAPTEVGTVTDETVVLVAPVRPVTQAATVAPVSVAAAGVAQVSDGVSILSAPAPTQVASAPSRPVPGAGGLPRPAIIVGYPEEVVEAAFEVASDDDGGAVGGSEISYENVALRREFAENNRELYLSLVESGAFDPPASQMAVALQTEMKRMNCYTARIDGDWGRGSRASVDRYYAEIGGSAPSQDPTLEIWRQLMLKDDVRCPDPVVAAPAPRRSNTQSAPRRTTTQAAPRRQAAPAPAPAPASPPRRTISQSSGTGVFR